MRRGSVDGDEVDLAEGAAVGGAAEEEEEARPGPALDLGHRGDLVEVEVLGQEVLALGDAASLGDEGGEEPLLGGVGAAGRGRHRDGGTTREADQHGERHPAEQWRRRSARARAQTARIRELLAGGGPIRGVTEALPHVADDAGTELLLVHVRTAPDESASAGRSSAW